VTTPQRILVLGGGGMLGHKMVQTLAAEFDTWATVRGTASALAEHGLLPAERIAAGVDALQFDTLAAAIDRIGPDAVINCIGIIKQLPTASDPVLNLTINSLLPHRLQRLCQPRDFLQPRHRCERRPRFQIGRAQRVAMPCVMNTSTGGSGFVGSRERVKEPVDEGIPLNNGP